MLWLPSCLLQKTRHWHRPLEFSFRDRPGEATICRHGKLEVYELIVQGRTNREISRTLFIAESTPRSMCVTFFEKLGVRSRVDAVRAWRLDSDWVD